MKTAKFRASRRLRCADTNGIMSPEISPKSFGTFEKQAPEDNFGSKVRLYKGQWMFIRKYPLTFSLQESSASTLLLFVTFRADTQLWTQISLHSGRVRDLQASKIDLHVFEINWTYKLLGFFPRSLNSIPKVQTTWRTQNEPFVTST